MVKSLPQWAKSSLYYLSLVTLIVLLSILMFYKGMIYQCNQLGLYAYSSDKGYIGFDCTERKQNWFPKEDYQIVPNLNFTMVEGI